MSLLKMLQEGYRMDKPNNAACSQKTLVNKNYHKSNLYVMI